MAGGEGTRLRPLTLNRPKPLVTLCNKPVMEYIIELLKRHGIDTIVVTLHYLANEVISYFGDGSDWGVQLIYSVEDVPLGTAGSVKRVEQYLDETFLLISGDALTDIDLTRALEFHETHDALCTLVLTRSDNPLEYGVVITDENKRIRMLLEKPSWSEVLSDTVNTGIYILEPDLLDELEADRPSDFCKDLFPALLERRETLYGYVATGYWCDIGTLGQYLQAHVDLFEGRVRAELPGRRAALDVWVGEGTEIHPSVQLRGPVVVGRNCRIREGAIIESHTALGDNCLVEQGATVSRSVLWSNVFVGARATLHGAVVGRGVTLKDGVGLNEGVVVGDKCFVGSGAVLHADVKVWPEKTIEAGANLNISLIWGIQWPGSLFGTSGICGLANIEASMTKRASTPALSSWWPMCR
jgi:mannose-1-phosphate guanylyltransferase / phosphomannomutase